MTTSQQQDVTKGTMVCVEGLKSEKGRKMNGQLGITFSSKAKVDDTGATRWAVFLFGKTEDDNEAVVLENPSTALLKFENLRPLAAEEIEAKKVEGVFRKSTLEYADRVRKETPETANAMHLFLCEHCIQMDFFDGSVDVDATFVLASLVIYRDQGNKDYPAKQKDALRVLKLLEPVVPLVLEGQSATALDIPNHALAMLVSQMLGHCARFVDSTDALHKYFRQALECAEHIGENLSPTDDDYAERRQTAIVALQNCACYPGEYLNQKRMDDPVVVAMIVRATEAAFAVDPAPMQIAGMANTYYSFAKDFVKAARWYRKALTLPEEECNAILKDAYAYWKHQTILAQLQLPGMPLEGYTIQQPIDAPGPSGQHQTYMCTKFLGDAFGAPGSTQFMFSAEPPLFYTIPTTDPDDADVFPPHILEMVQPHLLDEDGEE